MRKGTCVPMMILCLLLCGCGEQKEEATDLRSTYRDMSGAVCSAVVTASRDDLVWQADLRCEYTPEETAVTVLAPQTIAGVRAVLRGEEAALEYEDLCLDMGVLSRENLSPMACIPHLLDALRDGWLLEQNEERWNGEPCLRMTVDRSGEEGKILSTVWLRQTDGTPVRGEIAVDGEIILTAEFTEFSFCDNIERKN